MASNKKILERLNKLEKENRGSSKTIENIKDIQAGIGVNALIYQRVNTYIIATFLVIFGISYIIYVTTTNWNTHNKEIGFVVGGISLVIGILLVFIFKWYANFVKNNKNGQIFNAFLVESQIFSGYY